MPKFIGLNWKMHPISGREAKVLAGITKGIKKHKAVVFPPFVFIHEVRLRSGSRISVGAQDFSPEPKGALTGEVSLPMLKSLGVKYVLVGHSERRAMGETNAIITKKLKGALAAKMTPLLCVGEPWSVRKKGTRASEAHVMRQLKEAFTEVALPKGRTTSIKAGNIIIAYEPIWAIGTGRACSVSDAVEMIQFIKKTTTKNYKLKTPVLYGGSVDAKNVNSFLTQKEINGVLVGGASSDAKKLKALVTMLNR